VKAAVR